MRKVASSQVLQSNEVIVSLPSGRTLGVAQWGAPDGQPLFFFHGFPGSRRERHPNDNIAKSLGIRVITVDRPGIGLSTIAPTRTLLDWPDDIEAVADFLGIGRFAILGYSFGGAYALACAYKMPDRLTSAGVVSGVAPLVGPDAPATVPIQLRQLVFLARFAPVLLAAFFGLVEYQVRDHPELVFQAVRRIEASTWDRPIMSEPAVKEVFQEIAADVYCQGYKGLHLDAIVPCRIWGFRLKDIGMPVRLFYGTGDSIIPPEFGKHIQTLLPQSTARYFADKGHLLFLANWAEILRDTVQ